MSNQNTAEEILDTLCPGYVGMPYDRDTILQAMHTFAEQKREWVRVESELPTMNGLYVCLDVDDEPLLQTFLTECGDFNGYVTHWLPWVLPNPPKP